MLNPDADINLQVDTCFFLEKNADYVFVPVQLRNLKVNIQFKFDVSLYACSSRTIVH